MVGTTGHGQGGATVVSVTEQEDLSSSTPRTLSGSESVPSDTVYEYPVCGMESVPVMDCM